MADRDAASSRAALKTAQRLRSAALEEGLQRRYPGRANPQKALLGLREARGNGHLGPRSRVFAVRGSGPDAGAEPKCPAPLSQGMTTRNGDAGRPSGEPNTKEHCKAPHLKDYGGRTGQRIGKRHEAILCIALYRWGWATNLTLDAFAYMLWDSAVYSLGTRKWKKGLLTRRDVSKDKRVRGNHVYGLSPAPGKGYDRAVARLNRIYPNATVIRTAIGKEGRRHNPPTDTLPHLLHCQLIALALMDDPASNFFFSEPECRRFFTYFKAPLIPDLILSVHGLNTWVEYDRSPKSNERLWTMVQLYYDLWRGVLLRGIAVERIPIPDQLILVVPTEAQKARYQAAFESDRSPVMLYSHTRKRWEVVPGDFQDVGAVLRGQVKVMTLAEALGDLIDFL